MNTDAIIRHALSAPNTTAMAQAFRRAALVAAESGQPRTNKGK